MIKRVGGLRGLFSSSKVEITQLPDKESLVAHYYLEFSKSVLENAIAEEVENEVKTQMANAANLYFADMIKKQVKKALAQPENESKK